MRHRPDPPPQSPAPGTITAITLQQRDDSRVSIEIDGRFAFGLHIDIQLEHHLRVGMPLTADVITTLQNEDEAKRAILAALNLLSFRARSSGELARRLCEKGYGPAAVDRAICRMQELHYLDDAAYADRFVESRLAHRPRSASMIRRELRQKGIDPALAEQALDAAGIDEAADALALARKRLRGRPLDDGERRRLTGFLGRRGYGWDVIRQVLSAIKNESGAAREDDDWPAPAGDEW